jgi:hypothetical protein
MELESMAVEIPEVEGHPNRAEFRGVLTVVDAPSERAPSGAKGHRVILTRGAAESALPSLLGMALDYAPSFDRHDQRRKVGVITRAEIVGRNLEVGGFVYAKDFPEIVEEITRSGRQLSGNGRSILSHSQKPDRDGARDGTSVFEGEGARLRDSLASAVERIRALAADVRGNVVALHANAEGGLGMSYELANVVLADVRARVWVLTKVTFTGAAILRRSKAAYEETWIALGG